LILFIFVKHGLATIAHLYIITFCFSLVSPFFHRTEFTIIPCILKREVLLRGNGTLAGFRRLMQVVAPAIGGVVIALIGIESCFLIDSITFFISAACIACVVVQQVQQEKNVLTLRALVQNMRDGYFILVSSALLITLALYAAFINFLGGPILPLLPLLADMIGLGASGYGVMMSALSVGLIVSGFIIGILEKHFHKIRLLLVGLLWSSMSILLIGVYPCALVVVGSMFLLGMGLNISNLPIITLFQTNVDPAKIGVVSSFKFTIAQVAQPISIALSGFLADFIPLYILFLTIGTMLLLGTMIGFVLPQFKENKTHTGAVPESFE
jgi:DHA3 family macrolide efflux protein-like MFS transporter